MKHLVVGAGATFAEAQALGNAPEICPPLIRDFARKTWANYAPHPILSCFVCKPHGSLNMVVNDTCFTFGQPEWLGIPQPSGYRSYSGLIPPRLNKQYAQHPIAHMILSPAKDRRPQTILMWGVGFTESDVDLVSLYTRWAKHADVIEVINPDPKVAAKARILFACEVRNFADVAEWETGSR
jgi:hypothetical protein